MGQLVVVTLHTPRCGARLSRDRGSGGRQARGSGRGEQAVMGNETPGRRAWQIPKHRHTFYEKFTGAKAICPGTRSRCTQLGLP